MTEALGNVANNVTALEAVSKNLDEGPLRRQGYIESGPPGKEDKTMGAVDLQNEYAGLAEDVEALIARIERFEPYTGTVQRDAAESVKGLEHAYKRVRQVNGDNNNNPKSSPTLTEAGNLLNAAEGSQGGTLLDMSAVRARIPDHLRTLKFLKDEIETDGKAVGRVVEGNDDARTSTRRGRQKINDWLDAQG